MENKENSSDSANTSSDEPGNKNGRLSIPNISTDKVNLQNAEREIQETSTEDLSLHLELDESATLKETQDEFRMFSRIGCTSEESKVTQQCDKETQDFQLSTNMDEGTFSCEIQGVNNSEAIEKNNQAKYRNIKSSGLAFTDTKGTAKRTIDSQDCGDEKKRSKLVQSLIDDPVYEKDMFSISDEDIVTESAGNSADIFEENGSIIKEKHMRTLSINDKKLFENHKKCSRKYDKGNEKICLENNAGNHFLDEKHKVGPRITYEKGIMDMECFKTPQSSLASPTRCGSGTGIDQWIYFKMSDLDKLKLKWPDAYDFLLSKKQTLKRADVKSLKVPKDTSSNVPLRKKEYRIAPSPQKVQDKQEELILIKTRGKKKRGKNARNGQKRNVMNNTLEENEKIQSQEIPIQEQIKIDIDIEKVVVTTNPSTGKPSMKKGMQVFAKWTQKTDVRYYPGVISNDGRDDDITQCDEDRKFYVKFDDGFEKGGLKWDDMIPVGMLEKGHAINVEDADVKHGIFYLAKLTAFPEFLHQNDKGGNGTRAKIDVIYTVDYETPKEGCSIPKFDTERISYRRATLDKHQAIAIKKSLGGCWNPSASCCSAADMSLDNLISGKRRSRLSTPLKSSPIAIHTPENKTDYRHETRNVTPKADKPQALAIKKRLGGYWNPSASCCSVADMSLDNLISGKRRSRLSTTLKSPPTAINAPKNKTGYRQKIRNITTKALR